MMNRRTTLGPLDNQLNSQGKRMSMGFGLGMPSLSQPAANSRKSLAADLGALSLNGPAAARRSSVRQSGIGAGYAPPQAQKDPRPIREKSWQMAAIKNLIHFLSEANYDRQISPKILTSPSAKDFQLIFKFLYNKLDPCYAWTAKRFEDEVPFLLKSLKYPHADQISKNSLYSVGSMHTWPILLAALASENIQQDMELEQLGDKNPERIFFEFVCRSYGEYLMGNEDFEAMQEELVNMFQQKDQALIAEIQQLEQQNQILMQELSKLESEASPFSVLQEQKQSIDSDLEKIDKWSETLSAKHAQLADQISKLTNEEQSKRTLSSECPAYLSGVEMELEVTNKEKDELQFIVDNQEVSPADVDRMNAEREQLSRQIEQLTEKNTEMEKLIWDREIATQKKLDEVDKVSQDFNARAYRLKLVPRTAAYADGEDFELKLNNHAQRPDEMVNLDLRGSVKTSLMDLRSKLKNHILKCEDDCLMLKEKLDSLLESINEKLEDIRTVEARLQHAHEQYAADREQSEAEMQMKKDEIEQIERELRKSKLEGTKVLFEAQKVERTLARDYDDAVRRMGDQKERAAKELLAALEHCVSFKSHIEANLADVVNMTQAEFEEAQLALKSIDQQMKTED